MDYSLPKTVTIADIEVSVRYDFRVIMDIFEVMAMDDLSEQEKIYVALSYFYPDFPEMPDSPFFTESVKRMFDFINGGKEAKDGGKKQPKLVSWQDDYPYICAAVNKVLGFECRGVEYNLENNTGGVHWWTFLGAYMEIGECFFSQIVGIRSKKARNQKLDKSDEKFYKANKEIIDAVNKISAADEEWLKKIL